MAFDHQVHVVDPKTGRVVEVKHYAMIIDKDGTRYERPIGSGVFYNPDGSLIKRPESDILEAPKNDKKK